MPPWKLTPRVQRLALINVCLGQFMSALDSRSVTVALPTLSVYFDVSMAVVQWVAAGLSVDDRRPGFEHGRGWAIGSGERKSTRWVSVSAVLARPRADLAPSVADHLFPRSRSHRRRAGAGWF